jgi:aryl-alcohol dehydrogenase-like predicted oxidoreductase
MESRRIGELARALKTGRFESVQLPYNPRERTCERELLPLAAELGVAVIAMTPFGSGRLLSRPPAPRELALLREFGVETWPHALPKWVLFGRACGRRDPGDEAARADAGERSRGRSAVVRG